MATPDEVALAKEVEQILQPSLQAAIDLGGPIRDRTFHTNAPVVVRSGQGLLMERCTVFLYGEALETGPAFIMLEGHDQPGAPQVTISHCAFFSRPGEEPP